MEALSLFGFVFIAACMVMLLEYPGSPVMKTGLVYHPAWRRIILGVVMGIYIALTTLWAGKKSGAHANPVVTWAFFRLRRISPADTCAYIAAQFAGAVAAVLLLRLLFYKYFSDPNIDYTHAKPQAPHSLMQGFVAEFIITFIFVAALLFGSSAKKLDKYMGTVMGIILALFIIVELPFSSMSMNPARSFSGALAAGKWTEIWIYFTAPILGMLLASEAFKVWQRNSQGLDVNKQPVVNEDKFFGSKAIPVYPVKQ